VYIIHPLPARGTPSLSSTGRGTFFWIVIRDFSFFIFHLSIFFIYLARSPVNMPVRRTAAEIFDAAGGDSDDERYEINGEKVFADLEPCTEGNYADMMQLWDE
jgi:hypothetical protein